MLSPQYLFHVRNGLDPQLADWCQFCVTIDTRCHRLADDVDGEGVFYAACQLQPGSFTDSASCCMKVKAIFHVCS